MTLADLEAASPNPCPRRRLYERHGAVQAELIVKTIAQTAVDNEKYFCDLDAVVGDGDFGYSLARGFEIVLSDFDDLEYEDAGGLLKRTALVLTKRIGGTSGPIWGTAFLRAGATLSSDAPSEADVIAAMRAAIEGIKQRGNWTSATRRCSTRSSRRPTSSRRPLATARPARSRRPPRRRGRAPRRRRACSPSAGARRTPATAAATRWTRARWAWP